MSRDLLLMQQAYGRGFVGEHLPAAASPPGAHR